MNKRLIALVLSAGATAFVTTAALAVNSTPMQLQKEGFDMVPVITSSEAPQTERETISMDDVNPLQGYISALEPVKADPTPTPTPTPEPELVYLGEFRATAYCGCAECCGVARDIPITASGEPAQENYIAVDPRIIPLGTYLYIEGAGMDGYYYAMDTGGAIKGYIVDFYFGNEEDSHWLTEVFGVQTVWIYEVIEED